MAIKKSTGFCTVTFLILASFHQTACQSCSNLPATWIGKWRLGDNTGYLFQQNSNSVSKIRLSDNVVQEQYSCTSFYQDTASAGTPWHFIRQNSSSDSQCIQVYQDTVTAFQDIIAFWDGPPPTSANPTAQADCATATYTPPPSILIKQDVTIPCGFLTELNGDYLVEYRLTAQDPATYTCNGNVGSTAKINGTTVTLNSCYTGVVDAQNPLKGVTLQCAGDINNAVFIGGKSTDPKVILLSFTDTGTGTTSYYCGRILSAGLDILVSLDVTSRAGGEIRCQQSQSFTTVTDLSQSQDRYLALRLIANDCGMGKCQNGATCVQVRPGSFTCNCVPGYTGEFCETNIDECASSPCQNGGTCVDLVNQFVCQCGTNGELSGTFCEIRNLCFSNPCLNGGGCTRVDNSNYQCTCPQDFTGVNCETRLFCVSQPCRNGGTCSELPGDAFSCACPNGYTGTQCETKLFCVLENTCQNGATCSEGTTRAVCNCRTGFTGVNCETELFCVTQNNCKNGATCQEAVSGPVCNCVPGTTGTDCGTQLYCQPINPCKNGAVCTEGSGQADCNCAAQFTGPTCETELKCVSQNPCKNGATCQEATPDPTCVCAAGFTGTNCESTLFCLPNLCRNGAVCEEGPRRCVCQPGWSGSLCDLKLACQPVSPCLNGGTCTETAGVATCQCPSDKTGALCETALSQCDSAPCQNGGVCTGDFNSFTCACTAQWQGTTCSQELLECPARPCVNGGVCDTTTKTCTCATGFTGPLCQTVCTPTLCPTSTSTTTTSSTTPPSSIQPGSSIDPSSTGAPSSGGSSSTLQPTAVTVTPTTTNGSSGVFDWLPLIATMSVAGGLILLGAIIWLFVCCLGSGRKGEPVKQNPPLAALPPGLIGPAIVTAAPQPMLTGPPTILTAASSPPTASYSPFVEQPPTFSRAVYYDETFGD